MTDIVDEDLASATGWRRAAVATAAKTAAAVATSRRPAFVASAGSRRSGKSRFGLAILIHRLSVTCNVMKDSRSG